jgi:hypothetical protein
MDRKLNWNIEDTRRRHIKGKELSRSGIIPRHQVANKCQAHRPNMMEKPRIAEDPVDNGLAYWGPEGRQYERQLKPDLRCMQYGAALVE